MEVSTLFVSHKEPHALTECLSGDMCGPSASSYRCTLAYVVPALFLASKRGHVSCVALLECEEILTKDPPCSHLFPCLWKPKSDRRPASLQLLLISDSVQAELHIYAPIALVSLPGPCAMLSITDAALLLLGGIIFVLWYNKKTIPPPPGPPKLPIIGNLLDIPSGGRDWEVYGTWGEKYGMCFAYLLRYCVAERVMQVLCPLLASDQQR